MAIGTYSICGYQCFLMVILLTFIVAILFVAINSNNIDGYCW
jgi:hypothetical protein